MQTPRTYLIRCLLFLLFSVSNAISLARAVAYNHGNSVYWLGGMLALTALGCLYFFRAYLKSRKPVT